MVRMPKAYPFYDEHYKANVERMRDWLADCAPNVHPVGRNGMHRYNNQDHSMYTAMLTVENIVAGTHYDVWEVNVEEEYHEEKAPAIGATDHAGVGDKGTGRDAPVIPRERLRRRPSRQPLRRAEPGPWPHSTARDRRHRGARPGGRAAPDPRAGLARPRRHRGRAAPRCTRPRSWRCGPRPASRSSMRTSYAQGHPYEGSRDGYRIVRKHGRFMVFPTAVVERARRWPRTARRPRRDLERRALPHARCGPPAPRSPGPPRPPRHVATWSSSRSSARAGKFFEHRVAPPLYRRTPVVTLSESSRRELIDYLRLRPAQSSVVPPGIDERFTPGGHKSLDPLVVAVGSAHAVEALRRARPHRRRGARPTSPTCSW